MTACTFHMWRPTRGRVGARIRKPSNASEVSTVPAQLFPVCSVRGCGRQFTASSLKTRRVFPQCLHLVCDTCSTEQCPVCHGTASCDRRQRTTRYPLKGVFRGRAAPKDHCGRTYAKVIKFGQHAVDKWFAETMSQRNMDLFRLAVEVPEWLANRHIYTLRECQVHGLFVGREDNQSGCMRCAQAEKQYISLEDEPEEKLKTERKHSNTTNAIVHAWLSDVSEDDSSDYSDLNDFVVP